MSGAPLKSVIFVRQTKNGGLEHKRVIFPESEEKEVRRQYRGWHEAKPTERKCPKCSKPLLNYGLFHTKEGIIRLFRCDSDDCAHAEYETVFTPEQVKLLREVWKPIKHCGKKMRREWKHCPYCGEELGWPRSEP